MEAALLSGFVKAILPKLFSLLDDKFKLHKGVKSDIKFLVKELHMIHAAIEDELKTQRADHGAVPLLVTEDLRELAHGIEDCMDSLMYSATWRQHASVWSRSVRSLKTMYTNPRAKEMRRLKQIAREANERKLRYTVLDQASSATQVDESPSSAFDPRILDKDLVGLAEPRAKLLGHLAETADGQPKQLKVISIVGFWGSGKTALAAELYNTEIAAKRFEKHAWVCAALKGPEEVLGQMLLKLSSDDYSSRESPLDNCNVGQLCVHVRQKLVKKRYLIVIDDIQTEEQWQSINSAFPDDKNSSSRIVVTTTIQSIANACSFATGYVHKMSKLDEKCSEKLFCEKACPKKYSGYHQPDTAEILKTCDGQPLALVTVGEFLQSKKWPTGRECEKVCMKISYYLENDQKFKKMRGALMGSYASLPGHALKACLLYFCMFPSDRPVRTKRLLRRWLAEGFIEPYPSCGALDVAATEFDELMDRNIIEPVDVSNNDNVKTCQTYSIMREFILKMSISQNFVTLLCDDKNEHKYVRRLSLQNASLDGDSFDNIDLSLVRSLIIFGKAGETVLDFSKYALLRVLDLEECDDLKDDHLKHIGNLLLLKYLSLGGSVTTLPRDIAKLRYLGALDLRRTKVKILPVEVFLLPCLLHLLGKFKLEIKPKSEAQEFLSNRTIVLETLAGFIADESEGFLHLMSHMNKLRKLKIWCSPSSTERTDLTDAIQHFIQDEAEANYGTRSLSLHFDGCSQDFLNSLEGPCYLNSLKLDGNLTALPQFVVSLWESLSELCLSSTKLTTVVLEALSNLINLKYLKLIAYDLEKFIIKVQTLPNLLRLSLELQCPRFPTIEQGALPFLVTFQLLCKDLHGLSDIKIECHKHLEEVTLHPGVRRETKTKWEDAAKKHPNKPKVLLLNSVDSAESGIADNLVASEPSENETRESRSASEGAVQETGIQIPHNQGSFVPEKQNNCAAESSSNYQLSAAFNGMGLSEVSPALEELSSSMVPSYT